MNMLRVVGRRRVRRRRLLRPVRRIRHLPSGRTSCSPAARTRRLTPRSWRMSRAEARDNVRRLRHHPSLALWCGNNELEQGLVGTGMDRHNDELGPITVSCSTCCCPTRARRTRPADARTGRPVRTRRLATGTNFNEPDQRRCAPVGRVARQAARSSGIATLPPLRERIWFPVVPRTARGGRLYAPDDRNLTSYVMEYHQRSGIGNATIMHYLLEWFRMPTSFGACCG